jgi:hypothetical protein
VIFFNDNITALLPSPSGPYQPLSEKMQWAPLTSEFLRGRSGFNIGAALKWPSARAANAAPAFPNCALVSNDDQVAIERRSSTFGSPSGGVDWRTAADEGRISLPPLVPI